MIKGADDYVVKPFSLAVLYAKAQALLRRSRGMTAAEVLRAGALELNPARGTVTADGQRIDLPPKGICFAPGVDGAKKPRADEGRAAGPCVGLGL